MRRRSSSWTRGLPLFFSPVPGTCGACPHCLRNEKAACWLLKHPQTACLMQKNDPLKDIAVRHVHACCRLFTSFFSEAFFQPKNQSRVSWNFVAASSCFFFNFFKPLLLPLLSFRMIVRCLFHVFYSVFFFLTSLRCLCVLIDFPSLYTLHTVICVSHLQHENRLGCTPSHSDLCFVCASLHHCRPLVLNAFDAPVLPTCVAALFFLRLGPFRTCSSSCILFCAFLSSILLELFLLLFSVVRCPQPFSLPMLSACIATILVGVMPLKDLALLAKSSYVSHGSIRSDRHSSLPQSPLSLASFVSVASSSLLLRSLASWLL